MKKNKQMIIAKKKDCNLGGVCPAEIVKHCRAIIVPCVCTWLYDSECIWLCNSEYIFKNRWIVRFKVMSCVVCELDVTATNKRLMPDNESYSRARQALHVLSCGNGVNSHHEVSKAREPRCDAQMQSSMYPSTNICGGPTGYHILGIQQWTRQMRYDLRMLTVQQGQD